jgi:hypothetical protein
MDRIMEIVPAELHQRSRRYNMVEKAEEFMFV